MALVSELTAIAIKVGENGMRIALKRIVRKIRVICPNASTRISSRVSSSRILGKGFSAGVKAKLAQVMSDPKIIGDRGAFTTAVSEALGGKFGTKAADQSEVAKSAGAFHKTSAGSVRAQDLLDKIMSSDMTLAQLNAFFTDQHGGKAAITQRPRDENIAGRNQLRAARRRFGLLQKKESG